VTAIPSENAAQAAAHPLRATVLAKLGAQVYSPNELANELGASLGRVSYHVRVLHDLGMIKLVDTAPRRGAVEHYYKAVWQVRFEVDPVE
jgi:DNA-binding transcriptional ArsR family regulator